MNKDRFPVQGLLLGGIFIVCTAILLNDRYNERTAASMASMAPVARKSTVGRTFYRVTAYCPCERCCGDYADGVTASGYVIQTGDRFVAADKSIPFGTLIVVEGYNGGRPVPVRDRGGAIKGKRIDVYFDTHEEALEWGVREIEVYYGIESLDAPKRRK